MVYLAAVLGLQWGECAGLRVGAIDFLNRTVTVESQVTRGLKGRMVTGSPEVEQHEDHGSARGAARATGNPFATTWDHRR